MVKAKWMGSGVRRGVALLLLALAMASPMAHAARGGRDASANADGDEQIWLREKARQNEATRERGNDRSHQREQRLSPEERQQLRRDIRDAGQQIYLRRR